jgi:uncharacterized metal-binding protein YceD (DUF177 family)
VIVANEFARPIRVDTIGDVPRPVTIAAEADERAALARRFRLVAIDRLTATATLHRIGDRIVADGTLSATVVQSCVATDDPLPATIDEPFVLRFEREPATAGGEVELSDEELDVIAYAGGDIDLGEAVAETLSLALDPFPRAPDADARLREAGVLGEEETGPFAALKGLKDRLGGD